jgi:hypothetical protein
VELVLRESVLAEKVIFRAGAVEGVVTTSRSLFVQAAVLESLQRCAVIIGRILESEINF